MRAPLLFRYLTGLFVPPDDPSFCEIIRGQFHSHFVTGQYPDKILPQPSADMCQYCVAVLQLHTEIVFGSFSVTTPSISIMSAFAILTAFLLKQCPGRYGISAALPLQPAVCSEAGVI